MENLKIKVNSEAESKEAQELFFKLGYGWFEKRKHEFNFLDARYLLTKSRGTLHCTKEHIIFALLEIKEITLQELRDKVVLRRNNVGDATHTCNGQKYYLTASEFFEYINGHWENVDEFVDGCVFEPIQESKMTTLEQKENLKIRVFTEQQAKTAIELAEKLGYKEAFPKSFNLTDGYVCLGDNKDIFKVRIAHAGSELNRYKEISIFDLCGTTKPQHKEYLDPYNNYELIEWDGGFMVQDHWIEVPEGAEIYVVDNEVKEGYFYKKDGNQLSVFRGTSWIKTQYRIDSFYKTMASCGMIISWQRATQPEALLLIDDVSDKTAWETQVGGNHYKSLAIQPMEYALKNKLDFAQANVVKYVTRHAEKNGKADLLKAKHYIDLMIEHYYGDL